MKFVEVASSNRIPLFIMLLRFTKDNHISRSFKILFIITNNRARITFSTHQQTFRRLMLHTLVRERHLINSTHNIILY